MHEARQTPHGARPNREGVAPHGACAPARRAKPSGRSLEPCSNAWPRGMTVTAATPYRIRLISPMSLAGPHVRKNVRTFQFHGTTIMSFGSSLTGRAACEIFVKAPVFGSMLYVARTKFVLVTRVTYANFPDPSIVMVFDLSIVPP